MKVTIINQPPLRLIATKSRKFPEGNSEAFELIETRLDSLKGRKFYGLVYPSPSEKTMEYFAALVPNDEEEEREFTSQGFTILEVEGGDCARVKMLDWNTKTDQIGPMISTMIEEHGIDPSRPQMEFYRSLKELHLLVPVRSEN